MTVTNRLYEIVVRNNNIFWKKEKTLSEIVQLRLIGITLLHIPYTKLSGMLHIFCIVRVSRHRTGVWLIMSSSFRMWCAFCTTPTWSSNRHTLFPLYSTALAADDGNNGSGSSKVRQRTPTLQQSTPLASASLAAPSIVRGVQAEGKEETVNGSGEVRIQQQQQQQRQKDVTSGGGLTTGRAQRKIMAAARRRRWREVCADVWASKIVSQWMHHVPSMSQFPTPLRLTVIKTLFDCGL